MLCITCRAADDLLDQGETCCPNRVARLARLAGIKAQIGYKRRPGKYGGKPSIVVDNTLNRQFDVDAPDRFCLTVMRASPIGNRSRTLPISKTPLTHVNMCCRAAHEGFLYLAVVIDLYSRRVVGWATHSPNILTSFCRHCFLSLIALQSTVGQRMAVWRRKPTDNVLIHSDQGSQFTSMEWTSFLKHHNLEHSPLSDVNIACWVIHEPPWKLS